MALIGRCLFCLRSEITAVLAPKYNYDKKSFNCLINVNWNVTVILNLYGKYRCFSLPKCEKPIWLSRTQATRLNNGQTGSLMSATVRKIPLEGTRSNWVILTKYFKIKPFPVNTTKVIKSLHFLNKNIQIQRNLETTLKKIVLISLL